jgi:SAM-dependent methyltransferase
MEKDMNKEDAIKIAKHWGETSPPPDLSGCFYGFPPVRDYLLSCISGKVEQTEQNPFERWTVETYLSDRTPVAECLSLCCGFGHVERALARLGVFDHCTGVDLSQEAIRGARAKAKESGYDNIDYEITDLNTIRLEPEKYDLIWANGALHHILNLEHLISQIHNALKPGGILVAVEYVGPKYMELPFRQREIINSVIHLIPPKYRAATEDNFVPVYFRYPLWRRALFEFYRLLTFQTGGIKDIDSLEPKPDWPNHKKWPFGIYKVIRKNMPVRKNGSFRYGKVWDELSRYIKLTDPSESVRSDEVIPVLKGVFRDIDIRYFNGSILLYALDQKFFREYDPSREEDRALMELLINIEKTMIDIGELSSDHAHMVARKES